MAGYKLGRTSGAGIALRRNLVRQLFTHDRIRTTKAKAAAIRGEAEKIITIARNSATCLGCGQGGGSPPGDFEARR